MRPAWHSFASTLPASLPLNSPGQQGEYPEANNQQDDLWQIGLALGWRRDDHGNGPAAATPLQAGATVAGLIGRGREADWFSFSAAPGSVRLTLSLVPWYGNRSRSNLDARMALWGPCSSSPLASWDPQGGLLSGRRSFPLTAPGRYYVSVVGVGDGGPATGYSSYGSLGEYWIRAVFTPSLVEQPCSQPRPPPPRPRRRG